MAGNDTELNGGRHPSSQASPGWLESQAALLDWYRTPLGQAIAEQLVPALQASVNDLFGYQGLQVGNPLPEASLLEGSGLYRTIVLDAPGSKADVHGDVLALPVANDTMKCVVFMHTLDFCSEPHQALREADRVLSSDGQLVIIGFNPYSLFGLRHVLGGWRGRMPWRGRFYSRWRVGEWLSVLDYAVEHRQSLFLRPPLNNARLLRRLARLEPAWGSHTGVGGIYIMRAKKQSVPMTLLRQRVWQPSRALGASYAREGGGLAEPVSARIARLEHYRERLRRNRK